MEDTLRHQDHLSFKWPQWIQNYPQAAVTWTGKLCSFQRECNLEKDAVFNTTHLVNCLHNWTFQEETRWRNQYKISWGNIKSIYCNCDGKQICSHLPSWFQAFFPFFEILFLRCVFRYRGVFGRPAFPRDCRWSRWFPPARLPSPWCRRRNRSRFLRRLHWAPGHFGRGCLRFRIILCTRNCEGSQIYIYQNAYTSGSSILRKVQLHFEVCWQRDIFKWFWTETRTANF